METAFAILALVTIMVICMAGLGAVSTQVRCVDAAREAARLAARGDPDGAERAARTVGPQNAVLRVRRNDGYVIATVTARSPLLLGMSVSAQATAIAENAIG